jgi:hypothetical protein
MSQENSVGSFFGATDPESMGIPQFTAATSFYQILNGIVVQAGVASSASSGNLDIPLPAALRKQILSIQLTRVDVSSHVHIDSAGTTLSNLRIHLTGGGGSVYWLVIGV